MNATNLFEVMPLFDRILALKICWAYWCHPTHDCPISWAVDQPGVPRAVRDELYDLQCIARAALLARQYMTYRRSLENATSRLARNDLERRCAHAFAQLTEILRSLPDMDFSAMNSYYGRILDQLERALSC